MGQAQSYTVALDVTVARDAWDRTYGTDPAAELAEYVTERARFARRLVALVDGDGTGIGADVSLVGGVERPDPTGTGEWFTMRVALDVTVDVAEWRARWGLDPLAGLGPHMAAELASSPVMLDELDGTVVYLPQSSGRVVAIGF